MLENVRTTCLHNCLYHNFVETMMERGPKEIVPPDKIILRGPVQQKILVQIRDVTAFSSVRLKGQIKTKGGLFKDPSVAQAFHSCFLHLLPFSIKHFLPYGPDFIPWIPQFQVDFGPTSSDSW